MLLPELKLRRDKIRSLMAQQEIDAALIACNVNLIYTYGRVVSGYLYLPLNAPARLFIKRPNNIEGEHIHPIRKPEQLPDLLKEWGLPIPARLMLEGDELSFTEYNRLAAYFCEEHNPMYDAKRAAAEGYKMFCQPGECPFDLLKYGMTKGILPDVELPFLKGKETLHQYWDFIARYYLCEYYEGE